MKKIILFAAACFTAGTVFSQVTLEEAKKHVTVFSGVQSVDKKVLKSPDPQFMPYIALKFRTATSNFGEAEKYEKRGDKIRDEKHGAQTEGSSSVFGVLDVDSTVFQEITDQFYKNFTAKMAQADIPYLNFETIKNSKGYTSFSKDVEEERYFSNPSYGEARIFTQNNVPMIKYPTLVTKIMKWQNELGAALSCMRLTIDFVEYDVKTFTEYIKNNQYSDGSYSKEWTLTTTAKAIPVIKVECVFHEGKKVEFTSGLNTTSGLYMSNLKLFGTFFTNIPVYENFEAQVVKLDKSENLPEWATKKQTMWDKKWHLSNNAGTLAIKADRDEYKRAVLAALERYTDYIIEITKSYQKN